MTDKTDALLALADRIEALAFKMPAPNEWTPQFVSLAISARHQALAAQPAASVVPVDEAMVDRAIRAFENEPASHTDDDWDRRCMRAALTAALADGESASA